MRFSLFVHMERWNDQVSHRELFENLTELTLMAVSIALAFLAVRIFEFGALNVWWDSNAYGSIVWALLGFHTVHLLTDVLDSIAFAVLLFTGPLDESHFADLSENSLYWYFVVAFWLPIYGLIYLAPRLA